jgi:phage-related minor tail protein
LPIEITPILENVPETQSRFQIALQKFVDTFKTTPLDIKVNAKPSFGEDQKRINDGLQETREHLLALESIGQSVAETISGAFGNMFDAIAEGQNVFKSFGQVIKQVVVELIKAVLQAAILSVIAKALGVEVPSGNPFSALFGGKKAGGGSVQAGRGYLVGENGPEFFSPSVNGSIVPNGRISGMAGVAAQSFGGQVIFRIGNNELIGTLARGQRQQLRLV